MTNSALSCANREFAETNAPKPLSTTASGINQFAKAKCIHMAHVQGNRIGHFERGMNITRGLIWKGCAFESVSVEQFSELYLNLVWILRCVAMLGCKTLKDARPRCL